MTLHDAVARTLLSGVLPCVRFVRCLVRPDSTVASKMRIRRVPSLGCYQVRSRILSLMLLYYMNAILNMNAILYECYII